MKTEKKFIICCDNKEEGMKRKKQIKEVNESDFHTNALVIAEFRRIIEKLKEKKERINFINLFIKCVKEDSSFEVSEVYKDVKKKYLLFGKLSDEELFERTEDLVKQAEEELLGKENAGRFGYKVNTCCCYPEISSVKKINDYDGIVIPCELSWDVERTGCGRTQYAGISLAQRLREDGVIVPIIFTSVSPCEYIIKTRKDAEIIRTPALQHKLLDMLEVSGWKDILRSFDDMRPLNQAELKYTQLLYCSLRGMLVQIKHSISSSSNKDEFKGQIKYVLDKKFKDNEELMAEFNQTNNLELFCQKLINLMDNPEETMSKSKEDDTEFICYDEKEPIRIVCLEDNEKNDRNAHSFVEYVQKKNDEITERNKEKKEGEQKEKFRFAPVKVKNSIDNIEKWYKDYDVFIADIDIKNEKGEVVALGFEVVRHLIEDLGALSHVYYIVTNVTRSFYDQIKIPGISRIRLKEEVFGSDEKINRFLYGVKEAVDSKQPPKSDCQFIFEKLYAYIENESNYPIWYKFNYMKERKEEQKELNSLNEIENVVRRETTKLVHVYLLAIKDYETSNDITNHSLRDKALYDSFNKACENMQVYIGGERDSETRKIIIEGKYGRGNSALVKTMMKKKNEAPTLSNVNAFIVRLVLRRFFLYVREFVKYYHIKTIGDKQIENGQELTIDDLACRAIGPKGAYKEYDIDGTSQTKCLTEILMLTEDENKLESLLTDEEKKFVDFLTEYSAVNFDYSYERRIEEINFNY